MTDPQPVMLGVKVPPAMKEWVMAEAKRRNTTATAVVQEAVDLLRYGRTWRQGREALAARAKPATQDATRGLHRGKRVSKDAMDRQRQLNKSKGMP